MISFKGRHHQQEIILQCVRWYVAYSLSYRDLEELMQERGYAVDHSTIQGTDKLTRGPGLTLQKMGSSDRKYVFMFHFEPYYSDLPA
jgi:hypothetical protein